MHKGLKVFGFVACFVALLALSGAQWMALQSYAWVRMTVQFSQHDSLAKALSKTFSGQFPCALCLKVEQKLQEQKSEEQKRPWLKTDKMPEVLWQLRCLSAPELPSALLPEAGFALSVWSDYSDSPPTPPPRA